MLRLKDRSLTVIYGDYLTSRGTQTFLHLLGWLRTNEHDLAHFLGILSVHRLQLLLAQCSQAISSSE
jgi:hypothetical protein